MLISRLCRDPDKLPGNSKSENPFYMYWRLFFFFKEENIILIFGIWFQPLQLLGWALLSRTSALCHLFSSLLGREGCFNGKTGGCLANAPSMAGAKEEAGVCSTAEMGGQTAYGNWRCILSRAQGSSKACNQYVAASP